LDASYHIDSDVSHLIAVPLSEAKGTNNTIGERLFNLHEFNKRLANIDPGIINERKRQYAEVYQVNTYSCQCRPRTTKRKS